MKIVHMLPSLKGGGIQNLIFSLAPEQKNLGNDITIIVTDEDNNNYSNAKKKQLEESGIKIYNLNRIVSDKLSFFSALNKCRKIIKKITPDIVNTHGVICHIIGSLSTKGLKTVHCCTIHSAPEHWSYLVKIIVGKKPLIFCSDSALTLRGQTGSQMIAINNGINVNLARTDIIVDLRDELNLASEDKLVILVGSQRPPKNYPFLIKIVERLKNPHIHFCICGGNYKVTNSGGTNNKNYISTEIFEQYSNIHLLGIRDDVPEILNGSNIYLSCSIKEGLPISALEAFFAGIPCVLSPIIQHISISEGIQECYIPKKFDEDSFIEAIGKALASKKTHTEIYNERETALQKFTIAKCAKKYIDFYSGLI